MEELSERGHPNNIDTSKQGVNSALSEHPLMRIPVAWDMSDQQRRFEGLQRRLDIETLSRCDALPLSVAGRFRVSRLL
jgi:hypothetical protein